MPALNLDLDYFDHPKTKRLIGLLGRGAEVLPIRLWCYCGKYHSRDGRLTDYSPQEIESLAGWRGKPGAMLEAMVRLRFLDETDSGFVIHDWQEHAGHFQVYKDKATKAARARWGQVDDASSMRQACSMDASSNAPAGQGKAVSRSRTRDDDKDEAIDRPTLEEAVAEAKAKGLGCDAARWFHVTSAAGWVDSTGRPIRNWRAALAGWNCLESKMSHGNGNGHKPPVDKEREKQRKREEQEYNRQKAEEARAMGRPKADVPT